MENKKVGGGTSISSLAAKNQRQNGTRGSRLTSTGTPGALKGRSYL